MPKLPETIQDQLKILLGEDASFGMLRLIGSDELHEAAKQLKDYRASNASTILRYASDETLLAKRENWRKLGALIEKIEDYAFHGDEKIFQDPAKQQTR